MPIRVYGDNQLAGQQVVVSGKGDLPSSGAAFALATVCVETNVSAIPTVTASSAYASGNSVGGLLTFTTAVSESSGTGLLQKVVVQSKSAQTAQMDLVLFSATPSATTVADKTAFSLNTADFNKVLGVVHITDWTSLGTPSVGLAYGLALPVNSSTTSIFGALVTRGTPTYTATSDLSVNIQIIQG